METYVDIAVFWGFFIAFVNFFSGYRSINLSTFCYALIRGMVYGTVWPFSIPIFFYDTLYQGELDHIYLED